MKKITTLTFLTLLSKFSFAGTDVKDVQVVNVYQLDSDATIFEFRANIENSCGGGYWRVKSPNEAVANRKFSIVLTAFTAKMKFSFHDVGECEGNRSVVSWVRLESDAT